MSVLIMIPAYNESKNIVAVVEKIKRDVPNADYIIINDCSKDNTLQICKEHHYQYLDLPLNLGIGGGVQTGYLYALENDYDIAIQIDGDGQHDTAYIQKVIEPIEQGKADVVIGSRFINKEGFQSSFMRRFGINFLSRLIRICCGANIKDVTSGYRAVGKRMLQRYAYDYAQDYPEPEAIVMAALHGATIMEVAVVMKERMGGESSISGFHSIYYMIKVSLAIIIYRLTHKREGC